MDEKWDAEWKVTLLEAALRRLRRRFDPAKLQIFEFYVRKEWPAERVAGHFGIPVEQVHMAKFRVTAALKEEVERLEKEAI